jgi:hypothetical protein
MGIKRPPVPDIASIVCNEDPAGDVRRYTDFLVRGAAGFNYAALQRVQRPMFSGLCTLGSVEARCEKIAWPAGRTQNKDAIRIVYPYAQARVGYSRDLPRTKYLIRRDLAINVGQAILYVERQSPIIMVAYPRKTMPLHRRETAFWLRLIRETFVKGDYAEAIVELLDLSALEGKGRLLRSYRSNAVGLPTDKDFHTSLQRFATAYDALLDSGFEMPVHAPKEKPEAPDLFPR